MDAFSFDSKHQSNYDIGEETRVIAICSIPYHMVHMQISAYIATEGQTFLFADLPRTPNPL